MLMCMCPGREPGMRAFHLLSPVITVQRNQPRVASLRVRAPQRAMEIAFLAHLPLLSARERNSNSWEAEARGKKKNKKTKALVCNA